MRKYHKSNTDYDKVEKELVKIEEKFNIEITASLEMDTNGIYPVIKFNLNNYGT